MLELVNIKKDYFVDKKPYPALKGINLYFPKQQFCSILGPSGCGKTTTLSIIGGLDKYTSGDLIIEGHSTKEYNDKDWDNYRNKRIGFVFQSYNLIPHLSILENVVMSLTLNGLNRREKLKKGREALDKVGLKDLYNKRPNQLSGGQMQRVAIARAIIHDPEIILADEPTGALDSTTSIQIMDLLKEISKDKLIIMVTHNKELAVQYSDRIIEFKDGEVENDTQANEIKKIKENEDKLYRDEKENNSDYFVLIDEKNKKQKRKLKKEERNKEKYSRMSFFSALKISLKNLLTKKGRTLATATAASFGIIGVALVLAVNNGFGDYIERMEEQSASQMPVTVSSYTITYEKGDDFVENPQYSDKTFVYPYINNMGTQKIQYNNITEKYINYLKKLKTETKLLNDYLINYGDTYSLNLTTLDPTNSKAYAVRNGTTGSLNSMISTVTGLPTTYWHVLYGEEEYISKSYDLIAGNYPDKNNMNELVLVVDSRNQISLSALKQLGFYSNDDSVNVDYAEKNPISFDDILKKEYKVFNNDEFYNEKSKTVENSSKPVYYYENNDLDSLYNDSSKGVKLKISGILRPKKEAMVSSMTTGLCYQKSLEEFIVSKNNQSKIYGNIKNNVVWKSGMSTSDLIKDIENINSSGSVTVSTLNNLFNKYFSFYSIFSGNEKKNETDGYTITDYLKWANIIGADLIRDDLKENGTSILKDYFTKISGSLLLPGKKEEAYPYVISLLAYVNSYSNISSIVIFPSNLSNKAKLLTKLDEFNVIDETGKSADHAANTYEQVFYSDLVGTFTESLSQLIDIISIVLIVFASISLLVSSVMTAIITYVSVIERTKEIGILRALGARKKDVGRLFEAECVATGFISGCIGCAFSFICCYPINAIINYVYPEYYIGNIASLKWTAVLTLIAISILLGYISSLIPARAAAKKDPVIALRSE